MPVRLPLPNRIRRLDRPSVNSSEATHCEGNNGELTGKTDLTRNKFLEVDEDLDIVGFMRSHWTCLSLNLL